MRSPMRSDLVFVVTGGVLYADFNDALCSYMVILYCMVLAWCCFNFWAFVCHVWVSERTGGVYGYLDQGFR